MQLIGRRFLWGSGVKTMIVGSREGILVPKTHPKTQFLQQKRHYIITGDLQK